MRILITGVSTRAIAESARASGYDFITLDYFGDCDQKSWCQNYSLKRDFELPFSSAALYTASQGLAFEAVAYTSNLENHPEVVARFAAGPGEGKRPRLLGNSVAVLARVRHWPTFFGFLRRQGIPVPETIYEGQCPPRDAPRRWLRKPVRSGGGHSISFWPEDQPPGKGFILQEYVRGTACSASFVADGRECVVLGLTEQLIGRPEFSARGFRYCGNILPLIVEDEAGQTTLLAQVRQIAGSLTREFGLVGVNGLDFVLNDGQVYPLEVNPRYSASMELVERAYGLSIFDLHVRAVIQGELLDFDLAPRLASARFHGKAILYAERDGWAPDTRGWPER
ncbi:MAG: ATP-grasp domain-containing protein, partial [Chloroflexi bacterium]|nr:ATP-grasp domain-containing protein [Chloroflexota bacterium]